MWMSPHDNLKTFREVRRTLAHLCRAPEATIVLSFGHPIAILTPIDTKGLYHVGPRDRRFAAAKKLFRAALDQLRTHGGP